MKWRYRNDTDAIIIWDGAAWGPGEEKEVSSPAPAHIGLTMTQEGKGPDAVLCHEDLIMSGGDVMMVELNGPTVTKTVALSLFCMSGGPVEVRFNSLTNKPLPLDDRAFMHVVPWELCYRMYFRNLGTGQAHVSVSAVEVWK